MIGSSGELDSLERHVGDRSRFCTRLVNGSAQCQPYAHAAMAAHFGFAEQPERGVRCGEGAFHILEADIVRIAIDQDGA